MVVVLFFPTVTCHCLASPVVMSYSEYKRETSIKLNSVANSANKRFTLRLVQLKSNGPKTSGRRRLTDSTMLRVNSGE